MKFHLPSIHTILDNVQHIVVLLIILSILVVAHEWGHFIVARLCGMRVDDFSIGMGKSIWRIGKRGDTEYNVRMLPIGGFVKIAGMDADDEPINVAKEKMLGRKDDPDAGEIPLIAENTPEQEPYSGEDGFNAKPLWMRSLTILAGPVMSFLLGWLILCMMGWTIGFPSGKQINRVAQVNPGGAGYKIGLMTGDWITAINGKPTPTGASLVDTIRHSLDKSLTLTILRDGKTKTLVVTPKSLPNEETKQPDPSVVIHNPGALASAGILPDDEVQTLAGEDVNATDDVLKFLKTYAGKATDAWIVRHGEIMEVKGTLPAQAAAQPPTMTTYIPGHLNFACDVAIEHVGFIASVKQGTESVGHVFEMLGSLIKQHKLQENTGGVIRMYQETKRAAKININEVVGIAAQLSISLAIFNLLPIPILDGGHLLTFFIEWVRRGKKMTERQQQAFMLTGLVIIGTLFILINANDIFRTFNNQLPH